MANAKKTEMLQKYVSGKPKIEEAELNGSQQDDVGRVVPPRVRQEEGEGAEGRVARYPVCSFLAFSPSISPGHSCLNVTLLITACLNATLRSRYHSLCVQAQLFAVSPPRRPKPLLRRGTAWRPKRCPHRLARGRRRTAQTTPGPSSRPTGGTHTNTVTSSRPAGG